MIVRIAIVLLLAPLLSCSTSAPTTAPAEAMVAEGAAQDPSGSYVLETIDGNALPFRPVDPDRPAAAGPGPLVTRGTLVVQPGGQARYVLNYRGPQGREGAIRMNPTWRLDGENFVLVWPNGSKTPVTFDGQTFTIDNIGMKLAFRKEP